LHQFRNLLGKRDVIKIDKNKKKIFLSLENNYEIMEIFLRNLDEKKADYKHCKNGSSYWVNVM